ncbi:MAG: hypothetical protein M3Y24_12885, partial [Acidobacteriota bacterium]|nr:hypothetical protein [Acidobacteriota bacterium]
MADVSSPQLPITARASAGRNIITRVALASTVLISALWIYFKIFSCFSPWDDEGYLMIGVQSFVHGDTLYDKVYAQYGPFYYLVQWFYYLVVGAVTHDHVRFLTGFLWLASASVLAWCAHRLTQSWILTGFVYFAILKVLTFFAWSPGHPEEICLLLVACLLAISCNIGEQIKMWQAGVLGFLLSALALTKINIGFYVGAALLLVLLRSSSLRVLREQLFWMSGLASIIAVVVIMFPLMGFAWDRSFCLMMIFSLLAVLAAEFVTPPDAAVGLQVWPILIVVAVGSGLLILSPFLLQGTTLYAFLWSTVLQYKDFSRNWYIPLHCGGNTVAFSVLSFALAVVWLRSKRTLSLRKTLTFWLQMLKGAIGLFALTLAII